MSETLKQPNADDLVDIGEAHHKAGQLQEAEACYREALIIDPGHPGALYYLSNIAYEDGRLSFAAQLVEELLRGEPNDAEAWHLLGQIACRQMNHPRAIECLKKAVMIEPNYSVAYYSLATVLNEQKEFDAAVVNYQKAIALAPTFVEALRDLGNLFYAQRKFDEAVKTYRQAISAKPDFKLAYEGVGSILLVQEKWDEAIAIYHKALAENAGSALVHVGLGLAQSRKNQNDEAIVNYERAISLDPSCLLAYVHLGNLLQQQGKYQEAVVSYEQALQLNPQDKNLLSKLAYILLNRLREFDKAAKVYRQWQALEPDNPVVRHHLAGCTGESIPVRAANAYVEHTFDACADTFDNILGQLRYRGPQYLAEMLQRECGEARKQFAILDAGCGTGLCGPLVAEYAHRLVGVDLSSGMLEKAKSRNVYDELVKAELTAYLQSQVGTFDIVLSADTLIYFGELESLLAATRKATRNDGYFFFTVESFENASNDDSERGYQLHPHGRYSHSEEYLKRTLEDAGFSLISLETVTIRYEALSPVPGLVGACRAV